MTVQSLLKFEGADASTVFTDETGNQTWSINAGTPEIDTAQFKAGTSSLYINGEDSITANLLTPITGDFHIETWARLEAFIADTVIFEIRTSNVNYHGAVFVNNSTKKVNFYSPYYGTIFSTYPITLNTWFHVAIVKKDGTLTLWVNGEQAAGSGWVNNPGVYEHIIVGDSNSMHSAWNGWIDGFRILDSAMWLGSNYSNPNPDPTTTQETFPPIEILIQDKYFTVGDKEFSIPFAGSTKDNIAFKEEKIIEQICGNTSLQIWG